MSTFAIALISFYDNELNITFVDAEDWKQAAQQHELITDLVEDWSDVSLKEAKQSAFDADCMFDIKEVPK